MKSVEERFLSKVKKTDTCWVWTAACFKQPANRKTPPYGQFWISKVKCTSAHRAAYQLFVGPIPEDKFVLHNCDNPLCVNPTHLRLGNQLENIRESVQKGRHKIPKSSTPKLTEDQVKEIRAAPLKESNVSLALRFRVTPSAIGKVRRRNTWRNILDVSADHKSEPAFQDQDWQDIYAEEVCQKRFGPL